MIDWLVFRLWRCWLLLFVSTETRLYLNAEVRLKDFPAGFRDVYMVKLWPALTPRQRRFVVWSGCPQVGSLVRSKLAWGEQEWRRIGTYAICETCDRPVSRHPQESGPGYGLCGDDILILHRLCDGRLVKL